MTPWTLVVGGYLLWIEEGSRTSTVDYYIPGP
jgi:hypothetical protein